VEFTAFFDDFRFGVAAEVAINGGYLARTELEVDRNDFQALGDVRGVTAREVSEN
jgi:hypothetical protein